MSSRPSNALKVIAVAVVTLIVVAKCLEACNTVARILRQIDVVGSDVQNSIFKIVFYFKNTK